MFRASPPPPPPPPPSCSAGVSGFRRVRVGRVQAQRGFRVEGFRLRGFKVYFAYFASTETAQAVLGRGLRRFDL